MRLFDPSCTFAAFYYTLLTYLLSDSCGSNSATTKLHTTSLAASSGMTQIARHHKLIAWFPDYCSRDSSATNQRPSWLTRVVGRWFRAGGLRSGVDGWLRIKSPSSHDHCAESNAYFIHKDCY